jgi:phthalate 4,5-dioxygenase oxygenase subunit
MDDEHTLALGFTWHPSRALTDDERNEMVRGFPGGFEGIHPSAASFLPAHDGPYAKYWPKLNHANNWGLDYRAQHANERFSGIPGLWPQDVAVQRGFGPIADRTKEHLGASDLGQIAMRRRMMRAARALRDEGTLPPGSIDPGVHACRPTQMLIPDNREDRWYEEVEPQLSGPYAAS